MKTTIDKSDVFKRAWKIFKSGHSFYSFSFSASLTRAWEVEKRNIEYAIKEAARIAEEARLAEWWSSPEYKALDRDFRPSPEAMERYYSSKPSGSYIGD